MKKKKKKRKTTNMWESLKARDGKGEGELESWLCLPLFGQNYWGFIWFPFLLDNGFSLVLGGGVIE